MNRKDSSRAKQVKDGVGGSLRCSGVLFLLLKNQNRVSEAYLIESVEQFRAKQLKDGVGGSLRRSGVMDLLLNT